MRTKADLNQWKNTKAVIDWFKDIKDKKDLLFIQFDVCEFYPSISENLLDLALDFASEYTNITDEEKDIIIHAKKTFLFHEGTPWVKKGDSNFDVGMGSFDGAETCEIVGLFLLSKLKHLGLNLGLYRDDGLGVSHLPAQQLERE